MESRKEVSPAHFARMHQGINHAGLLPVKA